MASTAIFIEATLPKQSVCMRLRFFDGDHVHPFVRAAVQTGVMGEFRFVTLGAGRKTGWDDLHLLRPPLIAPGSGYFMLGVWHRFLVSIAAVVTGLLPSLL
jgi:hypothetical protein